MERIELTKRQTQIVDIVKREGPITGEHIAEKLKLTRGALRPDLAILTMAGLLEARPRVGYYFTGKTPRDLVAEEIGKVLVKNLRSVPIVIKEDATVYEAVVTMFLEDVGTLFVVKDGGFLEGVISRKDLVKTMLGGIDIHKVPVGVIMTRMPNIVMTVPEEPVVKAAEKLMTRQVDALPVVRPVQTEDGKDRYEIIGRLTKTSIARLFVELGKGGD